MRQGFRQRKGKRFPTPVAVLLVVVLACGLFEFIRVVIPFQSQNPFWQEVTIGQPVINGWLYGGQNEEGDLRFYNGTETTVLPSTAHMFDADGFFVVIEHFTPSTLTFAQPYDAIPTGWLVLGAGTAIAAGGLLYLRLRRRTGLLLPKRRQPASLRLPFASVWRSGQGGHYRQRLSPFAAGLSRRTKRGRFRATRRPRR